MESQILSLMQLERLYTVETLSDYLCGGSREGTKAIRAALGKLCRAGKIVSSHSYALGFTYSVAS